MGRSARGEFAYQGVYRYLDALIAQADYAERGVYPPCATWPGAFGFRWRPYSARTACWSVKAGFVRCPNQGTS